MKRPRGNQNGSIQEKKLKEKKQKSLDGNEKHNGATLKDFFKNPPSRQADTDGKVIDRFEQDTELAIRLSLSASSSEAQMENPVTVTPLAFDITTNLSLKEQFNLNAISNQTDIETSVLSRTDTVASPTREDENKQYTSTVTEVTSYSQMSCPICSKALEKFTPSETQEHVNSCLDKPKDRDERDSTSTDTPIAIPISNDDATKKSQATSWTQFFGNIHSKISGVWSSRNDQAPGMRGNTSAKQWFGEDRKPNIPPSRGPRNCPFYKKLPGTTLTVDAFCYGKVSDCTGYFLSHFHSDHYTRLASNWRHGPIYCSKVTANLVIQQLRVDPQWVKPLPMDVECQIENSNVTVTLIDANHCPGSAILLFKVPQPNGNGHLRYLHTGDFRAAPKMCLHPHIIQPANPHIDILYLDTTYLDPRYAFPAQEESVMAACQIVMQRVMKEKEIEDDDPVNPRLETFFASSRASSVADKSSSELNEPSNVEPEGESEDASFEAFNDEEEVREEEEEDMDDFSYDANFFENVNQIEREGSSISSSLNSTDDWKCAPDSSSSPSVDVPQNQTLVVVGTYSIGKEKIFYEIAKLLNTKVFVTAAKRRIILCQENVELEAMLTDNPKEAGVHVIPLMHLKADNLTAYVKSLSPYFTSVLAFRPTGWTFKSSAAQTMDMSSASLEYITGHTPKFSAKSLRPSYSSPIVTIYGIPYSEHSSFRELAAFIGSLDIKRIVPTVNVGSERSRQKMGNYFRKWEAEKRMKGNIEIVPYKVINHW